MTIQCHSKSHVWSQSKGNKALSDTHNVDLNNIIVVSTSLIVTSQQTDIIVSKILDSNRKWPSSRSVKVNNNLNLGWSVCDFVLVDHVYTLQLHRFRNTKLINFVEVDIPLYQSAFSTPVGANAVGILDYRLILK